MAKNATCKRSSKHTETAKEPDGIVADATGEVANPASLETKKAEAVSARLAELEQAMGAVSSAMDLFDSLLGLCQRMAVKSQQAAAVAERFAVWPPLTLLHSAVHMPQRDIIEELERMSSELARMGAEYRLLKGEQRDAASSMQEGDNKHD